ncbi:hypothetical protein V8F33_007883 [Rhypophila sp. PSN 637]
MEPPGYTPASPSLKGLPTETITQICKDLEPVDVASLRLDTRLADIGRPFLVPKHYKLNFSAYSIERLSLFAMNAQWKRRIEETTYNVGDRLATPSVPQWERAEFYTILEAEDDFSDRKAKRATFRAYNKWMTDQRSDEKMLMTSLLLDYHVIKRVIGEQGLPNLHSFNVTTLPCVARGNLPHVVKYMVKPHGYELRDLLDGLSEHLREKCSILRAVGMDQRLFQHFHGAPGWRPFEQIPTITRLELLIKDEYCQATHVMWPTPTLPEFLGLLRSILHSPDARPSGSLSRSQRLSPVSPDLDQAHSQIIDANPTENWFRMRNLRRLTLRNVAWNRQQMIQLIHFHKDTLEQVTLIDCQFQKMRWAIITDLSTLVEELTAYSHIHFRISNILGRENSVFIYEDFDNDERDRAYLHWVLSRKNGKDYRVTYYNSSDALAARNHVLAIRKQLGGVIGEDLVLGYEIRDE